MPTKKTRINLTVDDDLDLLITELAELQGMSKAGLVIDYLEALKPQMMDIRDAIRAVNKKKDPSMLLRKMMINGHQTFLDALKQGIDDD